LNSGTATNDNDTVGVTGSSPVPPTTFLHVHSIESGRSETVRDARNNVTTTVYNARNDVVSRVDALGNVTECFFDPVGGLTGVLHKNDPPFTIAYDAARVPPQTCFGVLWGGGLRAIGWFCTGATPNSFWGALGRRVESDWVVLHGCHPKLVLGCSGAGGCNARSRLRALAGCSGRGFAFLKQESESGAFPVGVFPAAPMTGFGVSALQA